MSSCQCTDSVLLMPRAARRKLSFPRFFPIGFSRAAVSAFWICTAALLTTQAISRVPFPEDGQVVTIQSSTLGSDTGLTHRKIFLLNGVIKNFENQSRAVTLAAKTPYPVTLIKNGSWCQTSSENCRKSLDYFKAFLNRFGNRWTGRGNEPLIQATKMALRKELSSNLSEIQIITHSEGGLIAYAAISELKRDGNPHLQKLSVILLGTPLHHDRIAELRVMVGNIQVISKPKDPVVCLQNDVFNWSSWLGDNPIVKQCLSGSDLNQHAMELYDEQLVSLQKV